MALKDLTAFLAPDLELPWRGQAFTVPPPTKDVGLKLAAINAAGVQAYLSLQDACPTCGRAGAGEGMPDETREMLESIKGVDLGELSLGPVAFQAMLDAGVPAPDLDMFAVYALYYWVLGEETADQIMETTRGGGASGEAAPGRSTPPRGPSTGSGNRTQRRASTRATGASRTS